jgi:CheY-like chemotaxis protein
VSHRKGAISLHAVVPQTMQAIPDCSSRLAHHGIEPLKALDEETLDLALIDLQMPELGGLEATHA